MQAVKTIGLDIAKSVFQVHGAAPKSPRSRSSAIRHRSAGRTASTSTAATWGPG